MFRRNAAVGICLGIAVLASCAMASNASALTWQTCKAGHEFTDSHCTHARFGAEFGHEEITPGVLTLVVFTNENTASETTAAQPWKLGGSLTGVETEIQCTAVEGSGSVENQASPMAAVGSATLAFGGCTVTKPVGQGCVVTGGGFTGKSMSFSATGAESVKLKPASGSELASIPISGCSNTNLNHTFPLTGSFVAKPRGATWATQHAEITAQETLLFGGVEAGVDSAVTLRMLGGNPISLT